MTLRFAGWILMLAVSPILAGSIGVTREIIYPTDFDVDPAQTRGGTQTTVVTPPVVTPRQFETRRTGVQMSTPPGVVGVTRHVTRGREKVRVRFDSGLTAHFITGANTSVRGHLFRGMGWKEKDYVVKNVRSGRYYLFEPREEE